VESEYRVTLPGELRENENETSLSSGVLTVRCKAERAQPRKIEVTEAGAK
jgi:HSP20 family molecular chaperone IbpA